MHCLRKWTIYVAAIVVWWAQGPIAQAQDEDSKIGREVAIPRHLQDSEECQLIVPKLIAFGEKIFTAKWTSQEGQGRPRIEGTAAGPPLSDPTQPLVFPRNLNRISGPDSNSWSGCQNEPFVGGGGDRATEVFVLGQRFDFVTLDHNDMTPAKGAADGRGQFVTLQTIANERKTIGMNCSGFIEMLARQMTADLRAIRDSLTPGSTKMLVTKGVSFGLLKRTWDGAWDTSGVQGLGASSLASSDSSHPPSLIIMPFHQAGAAISLRQFTNNAFTHHHGMQAVEEDSSLPSCLSDSSAEQWFAPRSPSMWIRASVMVAYISMEEFLFSF